LTLIKIEDHYTLIKELQRSKTSKVDGEIAESRSNKCVALLLIIGAGSKKSLENFPKSGLILTLLRELSAKMILIGSARTSGLAVIMLRD